MKWSLRIQENGRRCEERVHISSGAIDGFSISKATRTSHVLQLWKSKCQAISILEYAHDESDEAQAPLYVVDDTNRGRWIKEEAVVDSGAVECVASLKRVPRLRVEDTPQSMRGEIRTCAGKKEIKKEGQKSWSTG